MVNNETRQQEQSRVSERCRKTSEKFLKIAYIRGVPIAVAENYTKNMAVIEMKKNALWEIDIIVMGVGTFTNCQVFEKFLSIAPENSSLLYYAEHTRYNKEYFHRRKTTYKPLKSGL